MGGTFIFRLISKCFQNATNKDYGNAHFLLEENDWNDYNYYVTYHLHVTPLITGQDTRYLGYLKIMRKGQAEHDKYLLRKVLERNADFVELPDDFVSLTQSLDVFDGLNALLNAQDKKEFVRQIHLILSERDDEYFKLVAGEPALEKGLLRDSSINSYSLQRGREMMLSGETHYDLRKETVVMRFKNLKEPIRLNFSCLPDIETDQIPNGIITFIGKNGTGKSTLLYQLAKVLYAYPDKRFKLKDDIGFIEPIDVGISKLFLISYSPFDNFVLPGVGCDDYRLILNSLESGRGRLVFCGIRNVIAEFDRILNDNISDAYEDLFREHRVEQTSLKSVGLLAQECFDALAVVYETPERKKLWDNIMKQAAIDFPDISDIMYNLLYLPNNQIIGEFLSLSTGFKYFLHALSHVVAYIERDSMLLYDEPENHIHPPMLSFMISSLRYVISKFNSVLMIATHSPVIVQESFSENVYIVRNDSGRLSLCHPTIETYGANIAEITAEVFDLTTDKSTYYNAYNLLYETWEANEEWHSIDDMLNRFEHHLNGKISNQMMSYIISRYYDSHPIEVEKGGD